MRVTENMNFESSRGTIGQARARMNRLQEQAASTKRLNTPSDDPVAAGRLLGIRTDKVNNEQFLMNTKLAESFLTNSEQAVSEISDIIVRAKEIALAQSSGASANPQTRLAVAEEVTQLYNQAVAAANRRVGDRYLFGGFKTTQTPFDVDGKYRGDDGQMMLEISRDVFLGMNVPGEDVFNTRPDVARQNNEGRPPEGADATRRPAGASAQNINLFQELQALRIALLSSNEGGVRDTLERFDDLHAKLTAVRSMLGSRLQGVASASQSIERQSVTSAALTSALEDADMAQVMSDLAREETVFRGALASSQKLIQPTLLDFLK
ncbi:flagellar hook-associated protein 3 [bacterium]|nr:flagellar hook-associated protein 3 [bacterium]